VGVNISCHHSTPQIFISAVEGTPDDVLDHLLDSENYASVVSDLVEAVREFFHWIGLLFEEESA
jgi:hypothetical protein